MATTDLRVLLLRGRWGAVLPVIFKEAAEGQYGPRIQALYWKTARYKTVTGVGLDIVAAALMIVASRYPALLWPHDLSVVIGVVGGFLTVVGLSDGGTRAMWPTRPDGRASWEPDEKP